MNVRTTVILFLLVATLGVLILGVERYFPSAVTLRQLKRGPERFEKEKVSRLEILNADNSALTLSRENNTSPWLVEAPYNDLADPQKVAAIILALNGMEWIERIYREEFEDAEWQKTGLDKPRHKVRVSAGSGPAHEYSFGAPAVTENGVYVSSPLPETGEVAYYLARVKALEVLQIPPTAWRDPKLLRVPAEVITGITITQASGQIVLSRENEHMPWSLEKPLKTRGSKERITELLATLLNIEITEARNAAPTSPKEAAVPNGGAQALAADEIRILVESKSRSRSFELNLKKPTDDKQATTTATTSYRKPSFTVTSKGIASLWVEPNQLRDHLLAQIDSERLEFISISSLTNPEVNLRNDGGSWYLQRHGKWDPANGDRIARCLNALNTHEILDFAADTAADLTPYGLDTPFLNITWTPAREKPIKLMFGHNPDKTQFFAKYESEPFIYRIDASLLPSVPPDGIKWKGLGALRFTTFALRRITLALGANAPIVLDYNPVSAQWKATRGGRDVTAEIDRVKADQLAINLAKFTVQDWASDRTEALQALKNPFLSIQILLGEPGRADGPVHEEQILFSPTQPNAETAFYFGQIKDDPDVFYITRTALLQLVGDGVFKPRPNK